MLCGSGVSLVSLTVICRPSFLLGFKYTLFFFIRTSDFGAEAERSYIFLRFEAENVLKMFLNYIVYTTCISVNQCGREQETYQSALLAKNC